MDDDRVRQQVERLEGFLAEVEALPEAPGATAMAAITALLDLYGEALARVIDQVDRAGATELRNRLVRDELVRHLLILHGLEPEGPPVDNEPSVTPVELGPTRGRATAAAGR